jgi:hypothetical protein
MAHHSRRFLVRDVNIGDMTMSRVWIVIDRDKIVIRKYRSQKFCWTIPINEAVGILARRAQIDRRGV